MEICYFNNLNCTLNFKLEILNKNYKVNLLSSELDTINYEENSKQDQYSEISDNEEEELEKNKLNNILSLIDNI